MAMTNGSTSRPTNRGSDCGPSHQVEKPSVHELFHTAAKARITPTQPQISTSFQPWVSCPLRNAGGAGAGAGGGGGGGGSDTDGGLGSVTASNATRSPSPGAGHYPAAGDGRRCLQEAEHLPADVERAGLHPPGRRCGDRRVRGAGGARRDL